MSRVDNLDDESLSEFVEEYQGVFNNDGGLYNLMRAELDFEEEVWVVLAPEQ